jgi:hypothetical protein
MPQSEWLEVFSGFAEPGFSQTHVSEIALFSDAGTAPPSDLEGGWAEKISSTALPMLS